MWSGVEDSLKRWGQIGGSVGIFVHWAENDVIDAIDQSFIEKFSQEVDVLLVVRNCNNLTSDIPVLEVISDKLFVLNRKNIGYDFGGYREAIFRLSRWLNRLSEL